MKSCRPDEIARVIDHTLLRPDAVEEDVVRLCEEALVYGFHSVCVSPCFVEKARGLLGKSPVRVCTVIGFPAGTSTASVKVYEAMEAELFGADELDIVMNMALAKMGRWDDLRREIGSVVMASPGSLHKIILETGCLNDDEIIRASQAAAEAGAEFVKTSTGFGPRGASIRDVELMKRAVSGRALIKAAGGIRTLGQVVSFLQAGASRIGTSSGVRIMEECLNRDPEV
ncbi:MAG: deoxyribose-phosphate aldolase [Nitrospirae bacterium]|nr:deoxyribose-phosphate aldolase [Nitrospirota bacterium]